MPSANLDAAVATAVDARTSSTMASPASPPSVSSSTNPLPPNFENKFVDRMKNLRVGDPFDEKTELGPLATADAVKVPRCRRAENRQSRRQTPNRRPQTDLPGNYYAAHRPHRYPERISRLSRRILRPVASLFRVKDIDEAIRLANDSRFGLGASAWTTDDRERERFINELESGMVFINKMVASDPRIPFGGVKKLRPRPRTRRQRHPRIHEHQDRLDRVGGFPVET